MKQVIKNTIIGAAYIILYLIAITFIFFLLSFLSLKTYIIFAGIILFLVESYMFGTYIQEKNETQSNN